MAAVPAHRYRVPKGCHTLGRARRRDPPWPSVLSDGVHEGCQAMRTSDVPPEVDATVVRLRGQGLTQRAIAEHLNRHRVRTPTGRSWSHKTVQDAITRHRRMHETCLACGQSLAPIREAADRARAKRRGPTGRAPNQKARRRRAGEARVVIGLADSEVLLRRESSTAFRIVGRAPGPGVLSARKEAWAYRCRARATAATVAASKRARPSPQVAGTCDAWHVATEARALYRHPGPDEAGSAEYLSFALWRPRSLYTFRLSSFIPLSRAPTPWQNPTVPDEPEHVPTPTSPLRRRRSITLTADDFQPFLIVQEAVGTRAPPDTLYHYTGTAGLVGILSSNTLRLSHVSFLNDRSEMVYAKELITESLVQRREATDDPRAVDFLSRAETLVAGMFEGIDLYVSCFCEDGDLLSQWRGYSRGAGMYSLGFSSGSLHKPGSAEAAPYSLYPVEYEPAKQRKIINDIITRGMRRNLMGIKGPTKPDGKEVFDALGLLTFSLSFCLIFFKHSSFAAEQEWRIVLVKLPGDDIPVFFRQDPWYPTPYTQVTFAEGSLPLVEVKCGPAPEPPLASSSVRMLLAEHGNIDVPVTQSDIPLRW